ncbi:hypothetical protein N7540_002652 [Penicillium herquei]|nr:hypothetical protein N7540_002652 [Penicillium herquei]
MSLDDNSHDTPCFFAPYTKPPSLSLDTVQMLEDELGALSEYRHPDGYSRALYRFWRRYVYREILCHGPNERKQNWPWFDIGGPLLSKLDCQGPPLACNGEESSQAIEVSAAADLQSPQIKAVILVNAKGDNENLYRGEIMTVLRLIIHQMGQRRLIKHMKIPVRIPPSSFIHQQQELTRIRQVMVLSIIANRARLIEAFCENEKIVLRATPLYDFPEDIPDAFPTLAKWFHGHPTGIPRI